MNLRAVLLQVIGGGLVSTFAIISVYKMGAPAWALPTTSVICVWVFAVVASMGKR